MPGRSVITVSGWPLIAPSFLSTVTPGKLPTCCFAPVSLLNSVVLPLFWFPTSANLILVPSGSGSPLPLGWNLPPSPRPGCSFFLRSALLPVPCTFSGSSLTVICSASASLSVSSYPCRRSSIGSPIGANFTSVTSVPGIMPISRKCCLKAPLPPTDSTLTVSPIFMSFSVNI